MDERNSQESENDSSRDESDFSDALYHFRIMLIILFVNIPKKKYRKIKSFFTRPPSQDESNPNDKRNTNQNWDLSQTSGSARAENNDTTNQSNHQPSAPENNGSFLRHFVVTLVSAVIVCHGLYQFTSSYYTSKSSPSDKVHPYPCDKFVTELLPKYPTLDPMLFSTLKISIFRAAVSVRAEPATFIFLHNNGAGQISLIEDIIAITSQSFNGAKPIRLTSADLAKPEIEADYSVFIQQYRGPLEQRGILVVQDLDLVPAKAARAFFAICDSYEPLIERAAIFFTIDLSRHPEALTAAEDSSPTKVAETLLQKLWRDGLREDTLMPLLVRLTESVFYVY